MEIKIVEIVQTHYKDASDYPVSYGQRCCEACGGELDTGFRCMKCGRQHHGNWRTYNRIDETV